MVDVTVEHDDARTGADGAGGYLITADGVDKVFSTRAGDVHAVRDVSLSVRHGETLGLVGESGSGKSTMARLMMGLMPPTSGTITFDGVDLSAVHGREMRRLRARMQMVFQNPYGSLLPHYSVSANVAEPLRLHKRGDKESRRKRAIELLTMVGVNPRFADHYPRQFSGGQQQRVAIARALALEPKLLMCDEPTSSLDVSIQAQVLALLDELRTSLGLTLVFISHNLAVVERFADRVAVMCLGQVVEIAPTEVLFDSPRHPYTQQLLAAVLPVTKDPLPAPATPWQPRAEVLPLREVAPGHFVREA
ncbi:ABC transporter ATP-binding protein [Phytoactinopolyspora alkaliphila]|uniref:ABC transporter ATP-binding protein n=1 Tax=Phytoactinopolyspora alkaliphila TaxID=1783498 RepID=A0A6N9YJ64_9ACTN|nr:ATP-binding cassette domain-containing protein [Phytoactinopolyspora alkaliphila]NED95004.1 ABC transporter ATP-binding protein [Phytoactinopolyspora alkaliphila]